MAQPRHRRRPRRRRRIHPPRAECCASASRYCLPTRDVCGRGTARNARSSSFCASFVFAPLKILISDRLNIFSPTTVPAARKGHTARLTEVAFTPDGVLALTASVDCTVRAWTVATGNCLRSLTGHSKLVSSLVRVKKRSRATFLARMRIAESGRVLHADVGR